MTVLCSVVVPTRVIATGVSAGRPASTSAAAMSPIEPTARQQHQGPVVGVPRPVDFEPPQVTTVTSRWSLVVSGMPAYAGTAPTDGDTGDDLEADAGLDAGLRLLGAGGVEERVTGHQPHDPLLLAVLDDDLRAGGVGQRLAVLAEAAVDELGRSARSARSTRAVRSASASASGRPSSRRTIGSCRAPR